jgi:hypothetical protein
VSFHNWVPDFLSNIVALANFTRLSLLKAVHAALGECRVAGNPGMLRLRSGIVTFLFIFRVWWPESSEEDGPTRIPGVLRLRATDPLLSDRSARRFAPTAHRGRQDDGLLGILERVWLGVLKTPKLKKSQHS